MAIMKQIYECLTRAFEGKLPLPSKKWKGIITTNCEGHDILALYCSYNLILLYDITSHEYIYEWTKRGCHFRGLQSAKEWLEERKRKQQEISCK